MWKPQLPDKDFYLSLNAVGAEAYEALATDGRRVGGATTVIDADEYRGGFPAVEFFNEHHPDPNMPELSDQEDGLFKFEKRNKRNY